ncbi:monocarboxylate transporter 6 isoform 2-T3 [Spheniscus humboldti]
MSQEGAAARGAAKSQDEGWAWMVLLAAVLLQGLTLGFPSCIGVFFTDLQHEFQASNSETSWFPSIMVAVLHGGGPLCSVLVKRFGCRFAVMLGGLLSGVGMVSSSFCKSISQLYLTAGLITGLGSCFSFQAGVTVLGYYFVRWRTLANAMASTGVSLGFTLWPLLSQYLLDEMGWRNTFLIFGGILLNCCVCGAIMRPVQLASGSPLQSPKPAEEPGKRAEGAQLSNGASSPHPELQQQTRRTACFQMLQKYLAFDIFCQNKAEFSVLIIYCVILSIAMSGIGALTFQVLMDVVEMDRFSSALGLFTILESITLLIGPPLTGLLVDVTSDFHYVFYNSSFFLISAALFMGLSFFALEKKTKLKEASKVPLDNPSRYQYNEMPTEPQSESQSPPAVMYITSI